MTTDLAELGDRVTKALGWIQHQYPQRTGWIFTDADGNFRGNPDHPAECFKLCAEFQINLIYWSDRIECQGSHEKNHRFSTEAPHDNTPVGRLNAAIEAVLLAVLAIKEQS